MNEFDDEYHSRKKFRTEFHYLAIEIEIEKFLDPIYIYRGKIGIGSVGKSAATRYARGNLALPWPDRGRLRLVAFPGKHGRTAYPCAFARLSHRFTWMY